MNKILTPNIRADLIIRHRKERDGRIKDRIKAVLHYDKGWTYARIAEALLLSEEAVRKHVEDYTNEEKLCPENGGSEPKLNNEQTEEISAHLELTTYTTVKEIAAYVEKKYGIKYSISGMTNWLKSQRFSYHKPAVVPAKADKVQQQQWVENYNKLQESLPEEDHILFYDGVHPSHAVRPVRGWIKQGVRKELPTNAGQKRMNILGALNLESMKMFNRDYATIDATSTTDFFNYLQQQIPKGTINLVSDRARYNKCKEVDEYLRTNPRINIIYLPPYSPNLNAIEPCWKIMHEYVTNNKYYATFAAFKAAVIGFFEKIFPANSANWVDRLTDNFRIMHSPLNGNS